MIKAKPGKAKVKLKIIGRGGKDFRCPACGKLVEVEVRLNANDRRSVDEGNYLVDGVCRFCGQ